MYIQYNMRRERMDITHRKGANVKGYPGQGDKTISTLLRRKLEMSVVGKSYTSSLFVDMSFVNYVLMYTEIYLLVNVPYFNRN